MTKTTERSTGDMFSRADIGLGNHAFWEATREDPWWRDRRDYEALVRFWCPDLICRTYSLGGGLDHRGSIDIWETRTPSGTRIAFGLTEEGAWKLTLAMIYFHVRREQGRR